MTMKNYKSNTFKSICFIVFSEYISRVDGVFTLLYYLLTKLARLASQPPKLLFRIYAT